MERPVRTSHTATANLLTWSESPPPSDLSPAPSATSASRQSFKSGKREQENKSRQIPIDLQKESKTKEKMESPVRTSHTATANLLTWSESRQPSDLSPAPSATSASRHNFKPTDRISSVMFGGPMSKKEADDMNKRKPCSDSKMKEMTGSGIFAGKNGSSESEHDDSVASNAKTSVKISQQTLAGYSQISFGTPQENPSPKKPTSLTEVAKQRELSGSLVREEPPVKTTKEVSEAKIKEISGSDIFGPPPELPARTRTARNDDLKGNVDFSHPKPRVIHTSVKVSSHPGGASSITFSEEPVVKTYRKINDQKFQELTGNSIFKEVVPVKSSPERMLSAAKLREMSGSNIFSDGPSEAAPPATRDCFGGARQPPGGQSTIALI